MANPLGSNYERHPMVGPIWQKLESIEQHLDRLDLAVDAILKHLNISLPDGVSNDNPEVSSTADAEGLSNTQISEEPYEYRPLDLGKAEIRLLALNNSNRDSDEIRASLVHVSLEEKQVAGLKQYNALSYCWGEPKMDRRIVLDGHAFMITQNLESALRQMRKNVSKDAASGRSAPKKSLWWIDQICINQADIEERGNQVSLMRRIYKSAFHVKVWLGDAVEGSALAIELVGKIGRPPIRGPGEKEVEYPSFSEDEVRQHWHSLRLLLSQPWWERSWIRQEVSLGSRAQVFWGEHNLGFDVVSQAVMALQYADSLGHQIASLRPEQDQSTNDSRFPVSFYHHAKSLGALEKNSHGGRSFLPLPELLLGSRQCQASDQRDRVYSMLGLADPEIYRLRANYRLSLAEVLKSAARAILPQKKGLRLLGACQNPDRGHDLPSWVPNLIDEWKYEPFEPDDARHYISTAESSVEFDEDTLLVKGYTFDSVTSICETVVPGRATTDQLDEVYEAWQRFAEAAIEAGHLDGPKSYHGMQYGIHEGKEVFWLNFLSTDRMASRFLRYSADDKTILLPEREEGLKLQYMGLNLKLAQSYLLPATSDSTLHPLRGIRAALKRYGFGRRLGLCTGKQTLVLLPADTMVGDVVVVFRGATFPYVLRKLPGEKGETERYVLVGEGFLPQHSVTHAIVIVDKMKSMDVIRVV